MSKHILHAEALMAYAQGQVVKWLSTSTWILHLALGVRFVRIRLLDHLIATILSSTYAHKSSFALVRMNDMEAIEKECAKRGKRHWVSVKLDKLLVPMCLVVFFFFAWIGG